MLKNANTHKTNINKFSVPFYKAQLNAYLRTTNFNTYLE